MAGSIPVTALLPALAMVTAGVHTLYRCAPLFAAATWFAMAAGVVADLAAGVEAAAAAIDDGRAAAKLDALRG